MNNKYNASEDKIVNLAVNHFYKTQYTPENAAGSIFFEEERIHSAPIFAY
jgi:hypothetical protein